MSWIEQDLWADQKEELARALNSRAPNPSEYPELSSSSSSYWIRNYPIEFEEQCSRALLPDNVDVTIIGTGISGAAATYRLSCDRPDLRVAVLEARGICTGATGRNGGHVCRPEVYQLRDLAKKFSPEEALRLRRVGLRNRDMMLEVVEKLGGPSKVDLHLAGTLVVFETKEEQRAFLDDLDYAKSLGYQPEGYFVDAEAVQKKANIPAGAAKFGGAFLEKSGTIYPRKLVALLLQTALDRMPNLSIHPFTPAIESTYHSSEPFPYMVSTTKGVIRSRTVLHATNGYASHLVPEMQGSEGVFGCRAHMMGIRPNQKGSEEHQLEGGFGYADFFHWIMQRPSHGPFLYGLANAENIGNYNDCEVYASKEPIRKTMLDFLCEVFPQQFSKIDIEKAVTYDWTGVQGFTMNGCSIVGRANIERRGEFVSVGFNGEGMGRCFASATVVVEGLLNHLEGKDDYIPPDWFPRTWSRNWGSHPN